MATRSKHLRLVSEEPSDAGPLPSDEVLMLRVAEGDPDAFSQLIDRYQSPVRRFCSGVLGHRQTAEEAAQDAFLKLWQHRARYRSNERFRTYLYTIWMER